MHTLRLPNVAEASVIPFIYVLGAVALVLLCLIYARKNSVRKNIAQSRWTEKELVKSFPIHNDFTSSHHSPTLAPRFFDLPDFPASNSIYDSPLRSLIPSMVTSGDLAAAVQQRNLRNFSNSESLRTEVTTGIESERRYEKEDIADVKRTEFDWGSKEVQSYQDPDSHEKWKRTRLEFVGT